MENDQAVEKLWAILEQSMVIEALTPTFKKNPASHSHLNIFQFPNKRTNLNDKNFAADWSTGNERLSGWIQRNNLLLRTNGIRQNLYHFWPAAGGPRLPRGGPTWQGSEYFHPLTAWCCVGARARTSAQSSRVSVRALCSSSPGRKGGMFFGAIIQTFRGPRVAEAGYDGTTRDRWLLWESRDMDLEFCRGMMPCENLICCRSWILSWSTMNKQFDMDVNFLALSTGKKCHAVGSFSHEKCHN